MKQEYFCSKGLDCWAILQQDMPEASGSVTENPDLALEQIFMEGLVNGISVIFAEIAAPFYLQIRESKNHANAPSWTLTATNRTKDEYADVFKSDEKQLLFMTSLRQNYIAFCFEDDEQNYAGKVEIKLMMFGRPTPNGNQWEKDARAENLVGLTLLEYERAITKFYSDWVTHYIDTLMPKSLPITRLEE